MLGQTGGIHTLQREFPMIPIRKRIVGLVIQRWPSAEILMPSDLIIQDDEIIITFSNCWFITLRETTKISCDIFCAKVDCQDAFTGYSYLKQYQVNTFDRSGRFHKIYEGSQDSKRLTNWTLTDLIDDIQMQFES